MSFAEKIREMEIAGAVEWWNKQPNLHPLTCGKNSNHPPLHAELDGNDMAVMLCAEPGCGYFQHAIPDVVIEAFRKRIPQ